MLKIESNLKINGRHWGLAFVDGIAYTANVALAAKLLLKGYVVTDWPDQPVVGPIIAEQELSLTARSSAHTETIQDAVQPEQPVFTNSHFVSSSSVSVSKPTESPAKTKTTKPRKKAVTADAADKC